MIKKSKYKSNQPVPASDGTFNRGITKAGEFNGDLRDLPGDNPVEMKRPKRKNPKIKPIPAPVPVLEDSNN